ncbi:MULTISPECIES: YgaP-like transmembrane domain [unclassified Arthrobacter]|uniref:YgaP-like transmembrane domain n=1 Tax=unclassified Arthrobacter TaxID=235627 RepID=UPI002DFEA09B|nr:MULTISPECIES: YgaP-like transmembrane domain [unclassified Arthrobacter]MEC5192423.1 hypothetical protein [Arthrobacter sp. MP_M4]MEC5203907.1 hypothetical protein [Arthrobacter sp. MP_M7]
MEFVAFMRGTAGRVLRVAAGLGLAAAGISDAPRPGGVLLTVLGGVMITAGVFNFCLLAPVFHADLWGRPKRTSP